MPEKQNVNRRFIFETVHRVEVPISEDRLKEYLGIENLDDINETIMMRGLEGSIYSGEIGVKLMAETLTADPDFDRLGDYDITIEVEVHCEQHDHWHPANLECMYCHSPALWERVERVREEARPK